MFSPSELTEGYEQQFLSSDAFFVMFMNQPLSMKWPTQVPYLPLQLRLYHIKGTVIRELWPHPHQCAFKRIRFHRSESKAKYFHPY